MYCYIYGIGEVLSHVMETTQINQLHILHAPSAQQNANIHSWIRRHVWPSSTLSLKIFIDTKVHQIQCQQKELNDFRARDRELVEGLFYFSADEPWLSGVKYYKTGPSSFTVDFTDGRRVQRHLD